jgi:hypothetical protein
MHFALSGLLDITRVFSAEPSTHNLLLNELLISHPDDEFLSEPDALTNGFCFINNAAVAAAYLKHMYRDQIK